MSLPPFERFKKNDFLGNTIFLDPGETTGYSLWTSGVLKECGQLPTHTVKESVKILTDLFDRWDPLYLVAEEYRIYAWKAESHSWETLHTPRLIGCIETLATQNGIPYFLQGTQVVKQFATDDKIKAWNMWPAGKKHAADAIRHGIYWYCFGKP